MNGERETATGKGQALAYIRVLVSDRGTRLEKTGRRSIAGLERTTTPLAYVITKKKTRVEQDKL